jgi:hypothetical protein
MPKNENKGDSICKADDARIIGDIQFFIVANAENKHPLSKNADTIPESMVFE